MNLKINFKYCVNDVSKSTDKHNEDIKWTVESKNDRLKITLIPQKEISDIEFYAERNYDFQSESRFFANGFQSWTDSREFTVNDRIPDIGFVGKTIFGKKMGLQYVGDYTFVNRENSAGQFHSISFAYIRNDKNIDLVGSLDERTGFTVIYADMNNNTIRYSKDLQGITVSKEYEVLNLCLLNGEYDEVFDKYFDALNVKPRTNEKLKGYTSWYNYYQKISEDIILRDLNSLVKEKEYVNVFQIDDGFQTAVGDWLSIDKNKFPNGMKPIADAIHAQSLKAGLWLAPFGAQKGSAVAKNHPDWLIKNKKGKPICVGGNWGGFYGLDIYNKDARAYIKKVFDTVLNDWGFDLVKLDFIYACSVVPMYNKTRGQIACEAMDLLRECVGEKLILGCGIWMMPCFGKVDYMRIGSDMSLSWPHTFLRKLMHREDVSTPNAVRNAAYRRCFNGRAFLCDPDVFLLRKTNIGFTPEQQKTLSKFIKLFGSVLFISDNIADYDDEQLKTFRDVLTDDAKLIAVNEVNDTMFVDYEQNGVKNTLKFCVTDGTIY